uniref:Uncharacterized protein n=1 Tax=Onchocerca volvulus TaxID=6282 RepID=A0A8R1XRB3_ONCVO
MYVYMLERTLFQCSVFDKIFPNQPCLILRVCQISTTVWKKYPIELFELDNSAENKYAGKTDRISIIIIIKKQVFYSNSTFFSNALKWKQKTEIIKEFNNNAVKM